MESGNSAIEFEPGKISIFGATYWHLPEKRLQAKCLKDLKTSHIRGGQLELDWVMEEKTFCT